MRICRKVTGKFRIKVTSPDGRIQEGIAHNAVTDEGMIYALTNGAALLGVGVVDQPYIGFVDAAGFSAFAIGDTLSSHSGWSESVLVGSLRIAVDTSPLSLPVWSVDRFTSTITFTETKTATAAGTVTGMLLATTPNPATGSSNVNVLWCTASLLYADMVVSISDSIEITYACTMTI